MLTGLDNWRLSELPQMTGSQNVSEYGRILLVIIVALSSPAWIVACIALTVTGALIILSVLISITLLLIALVVIDSWDRIRSSFGSARRKSSGEGGLSLLWKNLEVPNLEEWRGGELRTDQSHNSTGKSSSKWQSSETSE